MRSTSPTDTPPVTSESTARVFRLRHGARCAPGIRRVLRDSCSASYVYKHSPFGLNQYTTTTFRVSEPLSPASKAKRDKLILTSNTTSSSVASDLRLGFDEAPPQGKVAIDWERHSVEPQLEKLPSYDQADGSPRDFSWDHLASFSSSNICSMQ